MLKPRATWRVGCQAEAGDFLAGEWVRVTLSLKLTELSFPLIEIGKRLVFLADWEDPLKSCFRGLFPLHSLQSCCWCMIMGWNLEEVGHAGRRVMMWFSVAASNLPIPRPCRCGCNISVPPSPPLPPPMTPPPPPPRHATATATGRCKGPSFRAASVVGLR